MKKMPVWALVILVFAAILGIFSYHISIRLHIREQVVEKSARLAEEAKTTSDKRLKSAAEVLKEISKLEDLEKYKRDLALLPRWEQEALMPVFYRKLFEAQFRRAEAHYFHARKFLEADPDHVAGSEHIERARKLYAKNEELLEAGIRDFSDDPSANARLNYLKGVHYYRMLESVKDPKKEASVVAELVGESAKYFSKVYDFADFRDSHNIAWRADVALEILQKASAAMAPTAADPGEMKLKLLPSKQESDDPTFGIAGSARGRH